MPLPEPSHLQAAAQPRIRSFPCRVGLLREATNSHAIQAGVVNAAPVVVSKSAGPPAGRTVNTRLGRGRLLLAARPAPAESTEWLRAAEAPQSRQLTCRHSRSSPISSESRS